jgi:8-oxo-dGTP diphosphatase
MYLSEGIAKITYFLFMGILLLNIAQKRSGKEGMGKRTATLYLGIATLIIYLGAGAILYAPRLFRTPLPDLLILPFMGIVLGVLYVYREKTFPFRRRCRKCGAPLSLNHIVMRDSNLCSLCEAEGYPRVTPRN